MSGSLGRRRMRLVLIFAVAAAMVVSTGVALWINRPVESTSAATSGSARATDCKPGLVAPVGPIAIQTQIQCNVATRQQSTPKCQQATQAELNAIQSQLRRLYQEALARRLLEKLASRDPSRFFTRKPAAPPIVQIRQSALTPADVAAAELEAMGDVGGLAPRNTNTNCKRTPSGLSPLDGLTKNLAKKNIKQGAGGVGGRFTGNWRAEFNRLAHGRQAAVRTVPDEKTLRALFDRWAQGATRLPARGAKIPDVYRLKDGTVIQWRTASKSGGATMDIVPPGGPQLKVHVGP